VLQGNRIRDVYKFHALITTYEVIISDLEELSAIDWRVAIIDEAHRLKNRNCKLLQGLTCFDMVSCCHSSKFLSYFLPRDASAERGNAIVSRPSVCLSVRLSVRLSVCDV